MSTFSQLAILTHLAYTIDVLNSLYSVTSCNYGNLIPFIRISYKPPINHHLPLLPVEMKILCLHGMGMNKDVIQTQLAPVLYELSKTIDIQLYCVNGPTIAPATMGVSELYQGPFFRYFNAQAPSLYQLANTAQHAAKSAPDLASPEDHARIMRQHGLTDVDPTNVCRFIDEQLSSQGPFDGVLGFSEGASAAATWLLRQTAPNSTQSFGFAIFLCGTAPVSPHSCDIALADELSERISIPTANIVGDKDPGYKNSLALYNLCNSHSATLYNHGRDHAIPWDPHVTEAIAKEIQGVIRRSQSGDDE